MTASEAEESNAQLASEKQNRQTCQSKSVRLAINVTVSRQNFQMLEGEPGIDVDPFLLAKHLAAYGASSLSLDDLACASAPKRKRRYRHPESIVVCWRETPQKASSVKHSCLHSLLDATCEASDANDTQPLKMSYLLPTQELHISAHNRNKVIVISYVAVHECDEMDETNSSLESNFTTAVP